MLGAKSAGEAVRLTQTLTIAKRIGRGRLGTVYAAVHEVLARRFAIKVLRPALTASETVRLRLRHAVREASQIDHPQVASIVDFGRLSDGRYYLTTDYVRGLPLARVLERDGRLSPSRAVETLLQLAEALDAAHRQHVVHGELKPNNITVFDAADGGLRLRLRDFAVATALAVQPLSGSSRLADRAETLLANYGTVDYLAPELLGGSAASPTPSADIYALGALGYHLLTGQPPFVGEPERVVAAHLGSEVVAPSRRSGCEELPTTLEALLLRCLQKDPAERFRALEPVVRALRALAAEAVSVGATSHAEEELTAPWAITPPPGAEGEAELLPASPGRLRQLLYETTLELAQHAATEGLAGPSLLVELEALKLARDEAEQLVVEGGLLENRFEDIRRELRESEAALRYTVIDLNLARGESEHGGPIDAEAAADLEHRVHELEWNLAELDRQREQRFATLNAELRQRIDRLRAVERTMAAHYRRLHDDLEGLRGALQTDRARLLYRRVGHCRAALAAHSPTSALP
ncbi:MAG: serine/threonine protein kinase [Proteobacteria bacterium]|nr:serine/threonine protein kinase [Pseudomonadota bacterium]